MTYITRGTKFFFQELPEDEREEIFENVARRGAKSEHLTEDEAHEWADDLINRNNIRRSRYEWRKWAGLSS